MAPGIRASVVKAVASLSSVQGASAVIAAAGNVLLARSLGAEAFGLYAVVSFLLGILALCSDFGMHQWLIRWPGEIDRDVVDTAFTLRMALIAALSFGVLLIVAPLVSVWYGSADLYWLIAFALAGMATTGMFRMSHSLLERDMEYPKLAVIELGVLLAFYAAALAAAHRGFGVYALVFGEACRGLATSLAFIARPFWPTLRVDRKVAKAIVRFGSSYLAMMFTWTLGSGVNPIVVGKIVGLKAAGMIRVAEAITGHLMLLQGIAGRVSYPVLARYQGDRNRFVAAVRLGRVWQCIAGAMPLFAFTALGFWLVPTIYGSDWRDVANVLPLLCLAAAVNSLFTLYGPALITIGRNWEVAKYHVVYVASLWTVGPICVYYFGYLGAPVAAALVTPANMVIHRAFKAHFGPLNGGEVAVPLLTSWAITVVAWAVGHVVTSAGIFVVGHLGLVVINRNLRRAVVDLVALARTGISERWRATGAARGVDAL